MSGGKRTIHPCVDFATGTGAFTDYYPFGFAMPGRQYITGSPYRFGYQGQFAEKDEETGLNHFEARLYDSRIGRWLTTDPANQDWSYYMSMGNNPVSNFDPDGEKWYQSTSDPKTFEWFTGWQSFKAFWSSDWSLTPRFGTTTNFGNGWVTTAAPITIFGNIPLTVMSSQGYQVMNPALMRNLDYGVIREYVPNFFGRIQESTLGQSFIGQLVYNVFDDAFVYSTALVYGPKGARHLNRSAVVGSELQDAGINTITNFVPIGSGGKLLKIPTKTVNAGQFNKLLDGTGITAAKNGGIHIRTYNTTVRVHHGFSKTFLGFSIGGKVGSEIKR